MSTETDLCGEDTIADLVIAMQQDAANAMARLEDTIADFPNDARLCFMKASVLLESGNAIDAHSWFVRALELAPDFAIARFQFGLFQLTSGEAAQALETWGRLDLLPDGHYLRSFVDGLRCLIRDDFDGVRQHFVVAMAANQENSPLNKDMAMLLREVEGLPRSSAQDPSLSPHSSGADTLTQDPNETAIGSGQEGDEELSETSILLQQLGAKGRFH
jgi:tetratricopeptide (TPR) repeat protein